MERRKTKLSVICVSILLALSILLTVLGSVCFNKSNVDNGSYSTIADYEADNYLGAVDGGSGNYIIKQQYNVPGSGWTAISTGDELKAFLKKDGTGHKGYLTKDIELTWSEARAYMAENVTFRNILDGCGRTITLKGSSNDKVLDRRNENEVGVIIRRVDANDPGNAGDGYKMATGGVDADGIPIYYKVDYHCFGGLVSVLECGILQNFTFKIEGDHYFGYKDSANNRWCDGGDDAVTLCGGLVGYNLGGQISNVVVELGKNATLGAYEDASWDSGYAAHSISKLGCINAVYQGLIVGAAKGYKNLTTGQMTSRALMSSVSGIMREGSTLKTVNRGSWTRKAEWGTNEKKHSGAALVGGVVSFLMENSSVEKCQMQFDIDCKMVAYVNNSTYDPAFLGGTGDVICYKKIGGIAAVNKGGTIASAMVTGNLNCMETGGSSNGGDEGVEYAKNPFVAEGSQPSTKIYKDATGGTNTTDNGNSGTGTGVDRGYNEVSMARLNTNHTGNGNNGVAIPYYFNHDGNGVVMFIPEGSILWTLYQQDVFANLTTGFYTSASLPIDGENYIEVGKSIEGEIGFYKKSEDGSGIKDHNGTYWVEMSDQVRMDSTGTIIDPIYYDGTTYKIMIKIADASGNGFTVHDNGLRLRNYGDLKNSMNSFNGKPVTITCTDNAATDDKTVVYSNSTEKLMVTKTKLLNDSLKKTLSINKRKLLVLEESYTRGVNNIFTVGAQISFNVDSNDKNSGLIEDEYMMWQDTPYWNGTNISLDIAGHQLFRPSTNNYILKHRVYYGESGAYYEEDYGSYFSVYVLPHTIEVAPDIYINGSAVGGSYDIVNGHDYTKDVIQGTPNTEKDMQAALEKNKSKREIVVTARANDSHYTAGGIRFIYKDGSINEYKTLGSDGLYKTTVTVSKDNPITKIELIDRKEVRYQISVNSTPILPDYNDKDNPGFEYGDKIVLDADDYPAPNDGYTYIFNGWKMGNTVISYMPQYTLRIVDDYELIADYKKVTAQDKYQHIYYNLFGGEERVDRTAVRAADSNYKLRDNMGWLFDYWTSEEGETVNGITTIIHRPTYTKDTATDAVRATVYLTENNITREANYGEAVILTKGKTYLVNGARVDVANDKDYVIYLINDMVIEEIKPETIGGLDKSITFKRYVDNKNSIQYFSITFVYGEETAVYSSNNNKPRVQLFGEEINMKNVTQYTRQGNIYQISMVFTANELECKFGNDPNISTFLNILTEEKDGDDYIKDKDGKDVVVYQYEQILAFRSKNQPLW